MRYDDIGAKKRMWRHMIQVFKMLNGYTSMDNECFFNFASQRHDIQTRYVANESLVAEKCRLEI